MKTRWILQPHDQRVQQHLQSLGFPPLLARIVSRRFSYDQMDEVPTFLNKDLKKLHSPFLFRDMEKAVHIARKAINSNQPIVVVGDYDVDGITSTVLLYKIFQALGAKVYTYIPDRFSEGYGFSEEAAHYAVLKKAALIITVDCGIKSVSSIEKARSMGISVILTDHHLAGEVLPPADAILNPHVPEEKYPYKNLAGVGIAFKLGWALWEGCEKRLNKDTLEPINRLLDLVALGTVVDVSPLTGENRILVAHGLQQFSRTTNPGLRQLCRVAGVNFDGIKPGQLGFHIGPRLNAGGRIAHAKYGVKLLTSTEHHKLVEIAGFLENMNQKRQKLEKKILQQVQIKAEEAVHTRNKPVLFFSQPDWHEGVIGIVTSRLSERFHRPAFLAVEKEDEIKGSARGIKNFHVKEALDYCRDVLEKYGGHKHAGGFSLKKEHAPQFQSLLEEYARNNLSPEDFFPQYEVDAEITAEELHPELKEIIKILQPFGMGNPAPLFALRKTSAGRQRLLKDTHLKFFLQGKNKMLCPAIYFNSPYPSFPEKEFDFLFTVEENCFSDFQLVVKDARPNGVAHE